MATIEEKFALRLASNELPVRNRALKRLKKWVEQRSALEDGFTEMELLKLWKGLYVCMWHSDKPLVQEELAENIASLVHVFRFPDRALNFVSAFYATMSREWVGIDRLRLDKFYMLIRKVVSQTFRLLKDNDWSPELVEEFSRLLSDGPYSKHTHTSKGCLGLQLHMLEVFLPELLSVATDSDSGEVECPGAELLAPALSLFAITTDDVVIRCIETSLLQPLQKDKTVQKLHISSHLMAENLRSLAVSRGTVGKNRKALYRLCKRFSDHGNEIEQEAAADSAEEEEEEEEGLTPPPPRKKAKGLKRSAKLLRARKKAAKLRPRTSGQ